jgi:Spy/CpxP family protein refolding chaperone
MRKLLFIAVVVVGVSALVLAGRAGGFGRQGFAKGPEWGHPEPGGREHFGHPGGLRHDGGPQMMLGMLDLTDEQKEVIAKLVEDSREKLHADIKAVLTDEQIEKLQQLRDDSENRPFGGLDLTEEQQAAIAEIREKARADVEAAETREARHEIMQAAHEEVWSVLTEEQIEKLEQLGPRALRGRGRGRR